MVAHDFESFCLQRGLVYVPFLIDAWPFKSPPGDGPEKTCFRNQWMFLRYGGASRFWSGPFFSQVFSIRARRGSFRRGR